MHMKKILDEEKDLIFKLFLSGKNCTEISKSEGITISLHLIRKILRRAFNI